MKNVLLSLFAALFGLPLFAAIPQGVDSVLYIHYRRCSDNVRSEKLFSFADTLFQLSVEQSDLRMQTAALSFKADYYYFNNNIDSLKAWIPRIQEFARHHNQLKYYYFTWNRLVLYYTKHAQYTLAQYELQRLLEQAAKDNYKPAIGQAYEQLGHIYLLQKLLHPSLEYYRKAVEYLEQGKESYHSMCNAYLNLAKAYTGIGDFDNAQKTLDKARKAISQPAEEWEVKLGLVDIYSQTGRVQEAQMLLRQIERAATSISREHLLLAWYTIYSHNDDHTNTLRTLDELFAEYRKLGTGETFCADLLNSRAHIYAKQGLYHAAYDDLERYITHYIQQTSVEEEQTLSQFATLLDVARLDREKTEAQHQAQTARIHFTTTMIITLVIMLTLAALFILLLSRMNRRLAQAKRTAEESSRMKGIFIRTITHEFNTPLNAIVGFTELAATAAPDNPERATYINIARENSGYLQKLVNDVLYISDIESSEDAPQRLPVELNECCLQAIKSAATDAPSQLTLKFTSDKEYSTILSSRQHLSKVLNELLTNAIRFTKEGTVILSYTFSQDQQQVTFTVTDNDPGVPAQEATHIFQRFVKLDPFSQGLGLGLSVCQLTAKVLGGKIYLDTSYTEGARFHFTIPTT